MKQNEIDAEIDAEIDFNKQMDEYANFYKNMLIQKLKETEKQIDEIKKLQINIKHIRIEPKGGWNNYIDRELKKWKNGNQLK